MASSSETQELVEQVPEHLFELWKKWPLLLASRSKLPVVTLSGETLTLKWGLEVITAGVPDCVFRRGRAWQMKLGARSARRLIPFGAHDQILIDFPPIRRGFFGGLHAYTTAPVGYTLDSLAIWELALTAIVGDLEAHIPLTV